MFPPGSDEALESGTPAMVCIDFAFALQNLCLCHTPVVDDWQEALAGLSNVDILDYILDEHWVARDAYEW